MDLVLDDVSGRCGADCLVSSALSGILVARITPVAIPIQGHSLPGLSREVVHHNWVHGHLDDVGRVGPIKLSTQHLRKIIQLILDYSRDWTISLPQRGTGRYTSKGSILYLVH
jgi:hypothetical protein